MEYLGCLVLALVAATIELANGENVKLPACPDPPYNNAIAHKVYTELDKLHGLLANGIPSHGIPPLDPLGPLPTVNISMNNAYLKLDGSVEETIIRHLSEFIICELSIEFGLRQSFAMEMRMEDFRADGNYDVSGVYALIFPIFGTGGYTLDVFNGSISGAAGVSYNIITGHAQIHNLELDILFEELKLYLECILGCGDMSDYINAHISEIATELFYSIWDRVDPILTNFLETAINNILKGVKLPPKEISSSNEVRKTLKFPMKNLIVQGNN